MSPRACSRRPGDRRPHLSAFAGPTHWARHHARGLQTLALEERAGAPPHTLSRYLPVGLYTLPLHSTAEELQKDSRAYFVLAEHAAWKIMPRYCDALRLLQQRLQKVRDRLPDGLKDRREAREEISFGGEIGRGLQGLDRDVAMDAPSEDFPACVQGSSAPRVLTTRTATTICGGGSNLTFRPARRRSLQMQDQRHPGSGLLQLQEQSKMPPTSHPRHLGKCLVVLH
ncbi:unnamed protein product [Durusdinium trenchii]|uniref:KIF-binding protein n=1 Tax=Durusdinium trenchii TaxID=1381693 RepID=A0ABP0RRT0_9DINO